MMSSAATIDDMVKAVLFDLDGTLLDTLEDIADSVNAALRNLGFPQHPAEVYKQFVGDGVEEMAARALPEEKRDETLVKTLVVDYREHYRQRWQCKTRPYEGIPELLDALTARGIRLAVLSNKNHDFTRLMVDELLSRWHFDEVIGAHPSLPRKPDPAGALLLAGLLQLDPAELVCVGDGPQDMLAARAAGMLPVGALWGFRSEQELIQAGAARVLARPLGLMSLLDE